MRARSGFPLYLRDKIRVSLFCGGCGQDQGSGSTVFGRQGQAFTIQYLKGTGKDLGFTLMGGRGSRARVPPYLGKAGIHFILGRDRIGLFFFTFFLFLKWRRGSSFRYLPFW